MGLVGANITQSGEPKGYEAKIEGVNYKIVKKRKRNILTTIMMEDQLEEMNL
jgi:hypothetical protein